MLRSPLLYLCKRLGSTSNADVDLARRFSLTPDADTVVTNSDKL